MYDVSAGLLFLVARTNGALVWDQLRAVHGLKKDDINLPRKH